MSRLAALILALGLTPAAQAAEPERATDEQKAFYTLGAVMGRNLSMFQLTSEELRFVSMGLTDSVAGKKLMVDPGAYQGKLESIARKRQAAGAEVEKKKADIEKKKSKSYLDKAAQEQGAVKTPSGLVYIGLKPGAGASPKAADEVQVHYHGTLTDGTVFDSSVQRGAPATFPLNRVIPCWTEGVQKMKVGGKAKLVCPSSIAYGDQGAPPRIPGGAALVFEVELLGIVKK